MRPNTLNICTLIVFHCLGHGECSQSQAFKSLPSPSFGPLESNTKPMIALYHQSSLSEPICLFSSCLTWNQARRVWWNMLKVLLHFSLKTGLRTEKLVCVKQTFQWALNNMCVFILNGEQLPDGNRIGWDWFNTLFHSHNTKAGQKAGRGKKNVFITIPHMC